MVNNFDNIMYENQFQNNFNEYVPPIIPGQKLKVFISSICGKPEYDKVRNELKEEIENTKLANVYLFEEAGASTISAECHYLWQLEDSDLCIFFIDNRDGVSPGVQKEIDTAKEKKIKSLYYFCDEFSKDKTTLEKSLEGAKFAKKRTISSFQELSGRGAKDFVDDIILVYHFYCKNKIGPLSETNENEGMDLKNIFQYQSPDISRDKLKNIRKCREYISNFIFSDKKSNTEEKDSNELDYWGEKFLKILLEDGNINDFNISLYIKELEKHQSSDYLNIIKIRWNAIQEYFSGNIKACVKELNNALNIAKSSKQQNWIIKDIMIDLRNQEGSLNASENKLTELNVQKELENSTDILYYPILDRLQNSLNEKYIKELYLNEVKSPRTVTFINNYDFYCDLIASSLIVSMYNGSLTHIILFYERLRNFVYYLTCIHSNKKFKQILFKLAVFSGNQKEIKGIIDFYPEVLNQMTSNEALSIMKFTQNHPNYFERLKRQLVAFGTIGYYLSDTDYETFEKILLQEIYCWLENNNANIFIGKSILDCLSALSLRISQNILSEICCKFFQNNKRYWYSDVFKFIGSHLNLGKMEDKYAKCLINEIIKLIDCDTERSEIESNLNFLFVLRKQNREITDEMDKKVELYFPSFFKGFYKLETSTNIKIDYPIFIKEYLNIINNRNLSQGKDGIYTEYGYRYHSIIRSLLKSNEFELDHSLVKDMIKIVIETIFISKESILIKLDAVSLLIAIIKKYPKECNQSKGLFDKLFQLQNSIETEDYTLSFSNISEISLKIALQLLYSCLNMDVYLNLLELMPLIQDDIATTISVIELLYKYFNDSNEIGFQNNVLVFLYYNILNWLKSENLSVRWNATRLLLSLPENIDYSVMLNRQILNLFESDNAYIKKLILSNIDNNGLIFEETKENILNKSKKDPNFVLRQFYHERKDNIAQ